MVTATLRLIIATNYDLYDLLISRGCSSPILHASSGAFGVGDNRPTHDDALTRFTIDLYMIVRITVSLDGLLLPAFLHFFCCNKKFSKILFQVQESSLLYSTTFLLFLAYKITVAIIGIAVGCLLAFG